MAPSLSISPARDPHTPTGSADDAPEPIDEGAGGVALQQRSSSGSNLLAAFFLVYVFILNVTTVTDATMPLPSYSLPISVALGLDQRWAMYSPRPAQYSYWFTIPGILADGRQIDLLPAAMDQDPDRAGPVSWMKPGTVNETFRDMYWLRYLTTLTSSGSQDRLLSFGGYICRSWNAWYPEGPMQLRRLTSSFSRNRRFRMVRVERSAQRVLWQHRCR